MDGDGMSQHVTTILAHESHESQPRNGSFLHLPTFAEMPCLCLRSLLGSSQKNERVTALRYFGDESQNRGYLRIDRLTLKPIPEIRAL